VGDVQNVNLAVVYRNDVEDTWFQSWSRRRIELSCHEFVEDFCAHFRERTKANIVEEFNKLKQEGSVEDYQIRFEELRSLLNLSHPAPDEPYFVSSFISGLSDELRPTVKILQPATIK